MISWASQKSTIVRFAARTQLAGIRTAFGTLERFAPSLGARWAARLWLTPPRYRGRPRDRELPLADTFSLPVGGHRITGRAWGAGPPVYLVHGWGGASDQLEAFVAPLTAAGHRVITFDAPSHGDSEPGAFGPRQSTFVEAAEALTAVVAEYGPAHAVLAHSGGCGAVFYALRHGLPVGRLVFLAPMAQPDPYSMVFAARFNFGERIRAGMLDLVRRRVGLPWSEFDIPSQVPAVPGLPPLLLVHDPRDRETRYADSVAVQRVWPNAELITVTGQGHWRILRDPRTVDRAVAFLTPPARERRQVS